MLDVLYTILVMCLHSLRICSYFKVTCFIICFKVGLVSPCVLRENVACENIQVISVQEKSEKTQGPCRYKTKATDDLWRQGEQGSTSTFS